MIELARDTLDLCPPSLYGWRSAAVEHNVFARKRREDIGGEQQRKTGDLIHRHQTIQRHDARLAMDILFHRHALRRSLHFELTLLALCQRPTGADWVDADIMPAELARDATGKVDKRCVDHAAYNKILSRLTRCAA